MSQTISTIITVTGYFALVAIGAFLGSRKSVKSRSVSWLSPLQTGLLLIIILALGIQLGANEEVSASLDVIGIAALVIAAFAVTGSVLFLLLLRVFVLHLDRNAEFHGENAQCGTQEEPPADRAVLRLAVGCCLLPFQTGAEVS